MGSVVNVLSKKPKPKLRRLANGYVQRNYRTVPYEDLSAEDKEQLELQELTTVSAAEQLDEDQIVAELLRIDGKYASLEQELETNRALPATKVQNFTLTLQVLGKRRALLESMLSKKLPDQRSVAVQANYTFGVQSAEGLSDDILMSAMAGTLTEEQMESLRLLLAPGVGGEQ